MNAGGKILGVLVCSLAICGCLFSKPAIDIIEQDITNLATDFSQIRNQQSKNQVSDRLEFTHQPLVTTQPIAVLPTALTENIQALHLTPDSFAELLTVMKLLVPLSISTNWNATKLIEHYHISMHDQPLYAVFDKLCQLNNLAWHWDRGQIFIYDHISVQVPMPTIPISLASDSNTAVGSQVDHQHSNEKFWQQLQTSLAVFCACDIIVHDSLNAITIVGSPRSVNKAQKQLAFIISSIYRQIELQVVLLEIALNGQHNLGINWELFSQKLLTGNVSAQLQQPNQAQGLVFSVGKENDFNAIVTAFNQFGKTRVVTSPRGMTMNNQPLEIALVTQTAYLESTTGVQLNPENNLISGGLQPGVVESGFNLVAIPNILADRIILQLSIKLSSLEQINSVQSGTQTIQTPILTQSRYSHRVNLSSNDTLIIGGISVLREQSNTYLQATSNDQNQVERVLLITPIITDDNNPSRSFHNTADNPWWRL